KWRNLASNNAVVTVIIVGLSAQLGGSRRLFQINDNGEDIEISVGLIGPYLIPGSKVIIEGRGQPVSDLTPMQLGNAPYDGGNLILETDELPSLGLSEDEQKRWLRPL